MVSPLANTIVDIVGHGSQEKMLWPNAKPIVAMMADKKSRKNGTDELLIGKPMRSDLEAAIPELSMMAVV